MSEIEKTELTIRKSTLILIGSVIGIILLASLFLLKAPTSSERSPSSETAQTLVIRQVGLGYADIVAEAGRPIQVRLDTSVQGCLRSVVFPLQGKRYSAYLRTPEDTLVLPALPAGTYPFSCTMGMGHGRLLVQ